MKVLIAKNEVGTQYHSHYIENAVHRLADKLTDRDVEVVIADSFDDSYTIIASNEPFDCLMVSCALMDDDLYREIQRLLNKLFERQENVPVFLLSDREKTVFLLGCVP
ncbi:Orn/Lys/Arg decarboxylase N-terminal domain-containing protein [Xenorhabdus bovienii]|uniref:Orn/Lys/Arg decarboxylase N-terminal domain-containing protein n=1 Tax=Xenorhabdus bovienii TaxID=40576 RepID=UPI0023B32ED9|nr:Orn/Lys/Arg decarboxylase N-terminal domain-containing protein [Xenorhabdus bovienii]